MVVFDYNRKPWKEVLNFIKTLRGKTLDVGCGNGDITKLVKNAVGVDISSELLEKARKKSRNIFLKARCEKLPFEDKSFDNALLIAVLHNLKPINRKKCLKEIYRVLRKKGRLFLSVWCKHKPGVKYIKWGKEKRYYYFFKEKELRDLLKSSGFKIKYLIKSGENYFAECVKS
jgi:ubiquinone/menaquinone biosynthesis C-methylase UbiE